MDPVARLEANRIVLVVGVDFSAASEYALALARNLVRPASGDAELHLVHVMSPVAMPDTVVEALPSLGPAFAATIEEMRKRMLEKSIELGMATLAEVVPHVRIGAAPVEIGNLARELRADLIIVGAHDRSGIRRALHRSIAARLARRAPCSVLTARLKEGPIFEPAIEPPCQDCLAVRRGSGGTTFWCKRHATHRVQAHLHRGGPQSFVVDSWSFRP